VGAVGGLGDQVRTLMTARGLSLRSLARTLNYDAGYLCRVRNGQQTPSASLVLALDRALGAGGELVRVHSSALAVADWEGDVGVSIDRRGFVLGSLSVGALPAGVAAVSAGASPTPELAEHLDQVLLSIKRIAHLHVPADLIPPLVRNAGSAYQAAASASPSLRGRLLRSAAGSASLLGSLHQERADARAAWAWTDRAVEWAQAAGDWTLVAHLTTRRAHLAWWQGDALRTLDLVASVDHAPWPVPAQIRATAAQYQARAHALLGDRDACQRSIAEAERRYLVGGQEALPEIVAISAYPPDYFTALTAQCYTDLGLGAQAVAIFERHRAAGSASRWGYLATARLARAHAVAGDPEQAATTAIQALPLATRVGSELTVQHLTHTHTQLATHWPDVPAVTDLADRLAAAKTETV
jgi:transcriptional regulator with XRE-family HTH domain